MATYSIFLWTLGFVCLVVSSLYTGNDFEPRFSKPVTFTVVLAIGIDSRNLKRDRLKCPRIVRMELILVEPWGKSNILLCWKWFHEATGTGQCFLVSGYNVLLCGGAIKRRTRMSSVMTWFCIGISMLFAAGVWFSYLIKIVLNDEVVQERKRRRVRIRELERRRVEDKASRKRHRSY